MSANNADRLLVAVEDYYTTKLIEHGANPNGVDWNGKESQVLRFKQLCKLINRDTSFSINDFGCGYGALLDYLQLQYQNFSYTGTDISATMITAAKQRYKDHKNVTFNIGFDQEVADFTVASGVFNVRLDKQDDEWLEYLYATLDSIDQTSQYGFAFNCLTSYSDTEKKRNYLYYADPCMIFDYCKKRYSNNVALLHDYSLYEFTIIVRKIS